MANKIASKISCLAIANRGEVAVRIIRACQDLNIKTVLLHSEADIQTRAYRLADKRICIGPAPTLESYLNIENNVRGALAGGAQAIHPGFGFLSENADFAEACEKAGLIFVGPTAKSIRTLGDKVQCKAVAESLSISMVPGYQGERQDVLHLVEQAEKIGFPVIVKAAAGGGGRGMKILTQKAGADQIIESAQREALSAFGSNKVFLEKYLDRAKHIEFQIFADATGRVMHLFDRECSVQRRHQKIIEEAPSPSLNEDLRGQMGEVAVRLVQKVGYRGAGTVEFLLQDGQFYFLEMNTRLQVEHPVTEMVLGIDLVKAQILTAQRDLLPWKSEELKPRGSSVECRIYAENPYMGGVPSTGKLGAVLWPEAYGRRFEYGFEEGDEITPYYDSMIAKIIVWDETRSRAIQKMLTTLRDSIVFGVHTNIPLLEKIISHADFVDGSMTTRFFEKHFSETLEPLVLTEEEKLFIDKAQKALSPSYRVGLSDSTDLAASNPWAQPWRGV